MTNDPIAIYLTHWNDALHEFKCVECSYSSNTHNNTYNLM